MIIITTTTIAVVLESMPELDNEGVKNRLVISHARAFRRCTTGLAARCLAPLHFDVFFLGDGPLGTRILTYIDESLCPSLKLMLFFPSKTTDDDESDDDTANEENREDTQEQEDSSSSLFSISNLLRHDQLEYTRHANPP